MRKLILLMALGATLLLAGCATTLDGVRSGTKVEYIGETVIGVASAIAARKDIDGCEVTIEDEVGRVVCW